MWPISRLEFPGWACKKSDVTSLRVKVLPDCMQVRDVAGQHSIERTTPTEYRSFIRPSQPTVGLSRLREEQMEGLVDAQDAANALQNIEGYKPTLAALPARVGCRFRRSEQAARFLAG